MAKSTDKFPITNQFLKLKKMYKVDKSFDLEEFNHISMDLIHKLADISMRSIKEIESIDINLWKDRTWNLIENAGLLPEYRDDEEEEIKHIDIIDNWYTYEED
jgi:hypothetical protein